jgi:predicted nuclease of predicted toxin-antitoxin system
MKLLFDQNLSFKLCGKLAALYPDSSHVKQEGLNTADDKVVWQFALDNDFVIVTKDSDFDGLSALNGHPPKVIRLRCGNQSTSHIESILRQNHSRIVQFVNDPNLGYLEIT